MKEQYERKEMLGGRCIEREVEWQSAARITYLTGGLDRIAAGRTVSVK